MTVIEFPSPFVHRETRYCRVCRDRVQVILLNGASCPRDPYYACVDCHDTPEATQERVLGLVNPQPPLDAA